MTNHRILVLHHFIKPKCYHNADSQEISRPNIGITIENDGFTRPPTQGCSSTSKWLVATTVVCRDYIPAYGGYYQRYHEQKIAKAPTAPPSSCPEFCRAFALGVRTAPTRTIWSSPLGGRWGREEIGGGTNHKLGMLLNPFFLLFGTSKSWGKPWLKPIIHRLIIMFPIKNQPDIFVKFVKHVLTCRQKILAVSGPAGTFAEDIHDIHIFCWDVHPN